MLNAIRSHIMRMITEDEKKREIAKRKQSREIKKTRAKTPTKKTIGWKYNSKTGRYEPNLTKTKRHNF